MRTQQQAEKAEQQRIKNLVLNYDLTDDQQDGEYPSFHYVQSSRSQGQVRLVGTGSLNSKVYAKRQGQSQHSTKSKSDEGNYDSASPLSDDTPQQGSLTDETGSFDTLHGAPRYDKSGNTRSKQRARQLNLNQLDWYGNRPTSSVSALPSERPEGQTSLDQHVVDKKKSMRAGRGGGGGFGTRRGSAHAQARGSKG
jgi:regulator of nonsense transcripts 2